MRQMVGLAPLNDSSDTEPIRIPTPLFEEILNGHEPKSSTHNQRNPIGEMGINALLASKRY